MAQNRSLIQLRFKDNFVAGSRTSSQLFLAQKHKQVTMPIIKKGSGALVTGGSSGIGFEFVKLLVGAGVNVLVADIQLSSECEAFLRSHENQAIYLKTDVTSWADLDKMMTTAHEVLGGVDLVVPNAGVFEMSSSAFWYPPGGNESKDRTEESRYKVLDINITHPIRLTQIAIEYFMRENKPGHIILVSSIAAQQPTPTKPMYCASKAAISSFVHSLGVLATPPEGSGIPRIVVNAVAPGMVRTPLWTTDQEDMKPFLGFPFDWLTPDEVARAMMRVVLMDDYVGGQVVEATKGRLRLQEVLNDPGPAPAEAILKMTDEERAKAMGPMVEPVFRAMGRIDRKSVV